MRRIAYTAVAIAGTITLICALLITVVDWVWFRPLIQHYVQERSQRNIEFEHLHVGLTRELKPNVRFQGLRIDNAPWADTRAPFVQAGEVDFTFEWRSFTEPKLTVSRLVLVDAQVDLQRQADGLRNWRLTRPDDRGPGRIRVMRLDARNSTLRFVHGGLGLQLDTAVAALDHALPVAGRNDLPLTKMLQLHGTRGGARFDAQLQVSDVLTFLDSGQEFALRGEATMARTRLAIDGVATDLAQLTAIDAQIDLNGRSLAELTPLFQHVLPASHAYRLQARLNKHGDRTELTEMQAKIGKTDLAGSVLHEHPHGDDDATRTLRARLRSKSLDTDDFTALRTQSSGRADTAALKGVDAELALVIGELKSPMLPPPLHVRNVKLDGAARGGVLKLEALRFESAGGAVTAAATLDPNRTPAPLDLRVELAGLQLEQLLPPQAERNRVGGAIDARAALHSAGGSVDELLRNLSGTVAASSRSASISNRLAARLSLHGGGVVRAMLDGLERVPVRCSALELSVRKGVARTQRLVMETDRFTLAGSGEFDLAHRSMALALTPQHKRTALLALDRSIQVSGRFEDLKVALVLPEGGPAETQACLPAAAAASAPPTTAQLAAVMPAIQGERSSVKQRPVP